MPQLQTRNSLSPRAALLCASTSLSLLFMTGCASEVPRYSPGIVMGDQGRSAEVVFESPTMIAMAPDGATSTYWRDGSLNIRSQPSTFDQAAWPRPYRPSLSNLRRLNIRERDDSILYFREEGFQYRSNRDRW